MVVNVADMAVVVEAAVETPTDALKGVEVCIHVVDRM